MCGGADIGLWRQHCALPVLSRSRPPDAHGLVILAALVVGALLSTPTPVVGRDRLAGAGGERCSAWTASARSKKESNEAVDQWILGYVSGRVAETPSELGLLPGPDEIIAQAARYCRLHANATVTDAVEVIWKLVTNPRWRRPSPHPQPTIDAREKEPGVKFRWPAAGRIIANPCGHPDGTHNDGIDLAVSRGAEIQAAENGRIAYAGNELKGFGNLILIRHDNGWVSAYAHGDEILVQRGDVVKRGQVIARAGKTADQPRLHFELRRGSTPVDPLDYLESIDDPQ